MANRVSSAWPLFITLISSIIISCSMAKSSGNDDQKVYIVYMGDRPKGQFSATTQHMSMLQEILGSKRASESWLHSYRRSFNGFVAKLAEKEKEKIASLEGVVSIFLSTKYQLHTTRSWDFIGFPVKVKRSITESDIIVGVIDTGIWPESSSFIDHGFGSPPAKWKGTCQSSSNFTCNNKIIGARYYHINGTIPLQDFPSPRDADGHGSHTASTAAGGVVHDTSMDGLALGTARGAVPSSRIAVYKVCWSDGCTTADILAAFDDAIADGVDILSVSLGAPGIYDYFEEPIAIAAFHAMKNGILTSVSAGNDGPYLETVENYSPWSLTVAASTIDRKILTKVKLGNNNTYEGVSVNTFTLKDDGYPLVYGGDVPNNATGIDGDKSRYCLSDSLDPKLVKGTIVFCDTLNDAVPAADAGAIGTIMQGDYYRDFAYAFPIPTSYLGTKDGAKVYEYIKKTSKPTANIFKSYEVKDKLAPFAVSFSSRGPNPITKDILKPDLSAPGADILAAWSEATTATGFPEDPRVVAYNIISGTSMSCPHASGAAAYVKSFNPTWSPAAIKSALMTTAYQMNVETNREAEFAYGSGQINPIKAKSPGLVYDMGETEYINFLCGQGYSNKNLQLITGDKTTCTTANKTKVYDLNYPSFTLSAPSAITISRHFHRIVTNVGSPSSIYKAIVTSPSGLRIKVHPSTLTFKSIGETKKFVVTVRAAVGKSVLSGSLVWDDGVHRVSSPIVAYSTLVSRVA